MVGVSIVLFALMGTIGVGYLLNGNTTYQTVDDYEYVTDVTGLYNYTPVTAYAPYSPAANNYQYSTSIEDLGTYTSGINYTEASAANLNPIITPSSGYVTTNVTAPYADLDAYLVNSTLPTDMDFTFIQRGDGSRITDVVPAKLISVRSLANTINSLTVLYIDLPNLNGQRTIEGITETYSIQPVGLVGLHYPGSIRPSDYAPYAIENNINAVVKDNASRITINYTSNNSVSYTGTDNNTYTTYPAGVTSNLTVYPNGIASYTYTYAGTSSTVSTNVDNLYLYVMGRLPSLGITGYTAGLSYTQTVFGDIEYLDPNYGVSTSADTVYWNNGNGLGTVAILLKKPTNATSQTFTMYNADDTATVAYTISYNGMTWTLSSSGTTVNMGKGWEGILVTAYYTGELQWSPVKQFTNFTDYRLGNTNNLGTATANNEPISYCKITSSGQSFNFAVVGTSVASGSVPGAMYNATFTVTDYFPQYNDVRVSFDSAAYVGTGVTVGTWTMDVDSGSFVGEFTIGSETYRVDLTKPWSINWTSADTVSITYTPYNKMGTQTVTILNQDAAKVVNLSGQWVIDTDLYEITSKEEPVYNWNFGHWGLAKVPFIVCVIGLIALLSIAYRITGVSFHGLDYAVIALASLIIWVIL